jgi:hypothetical protein
VIEIAGSSSGVDYIPYEEAYEPGFEDIERRVPDISRIVELTGYSPSLTRCAKPSSAQETDDAKAFLPDGHRRKQRLPILALLSAALLLRSTV